ncbi:MAG TPA: zincin-like metallopeptidase domain-containing protein [Conexibacter sp.]|jgi:antirestriction protein ArdC
MSTSTSRRRAPSAAERDARRAAERELAAKSVEALQESEGWQRWLRVRRHFHSYSLANQFLIALQRPDATRVAGFKAWLKLGYCVRRGETGIRIWAPMPPSKARLQAWRDAGARPADRPRTFFRLTAVFDRSQVDPLPDFPGEPAVLDPPIVPVDGDHLGHLFEPLSELASEIGSQVCVEAVPGSANGFYELDSRRIVLAPVAVDFSVNAQVRTLVHELSHALVRADRQENDPDLSYAKEEIVVETVAHCVCASIGFDVSGYSFAYIATWADGAGGTEAIEQYAALIDRLARRIEDVVVTAVEQDKSNDRKVPR